MPAAARSSASPATSGASGPTTTRPMFSAWQKAMTAAWSVTFRSTLRAIWPMPGLPGAHESLSQSGLAGDGPGQRMFAAAGTDEENVHECTLRPILAFARLLAFDAAESKRGICNVHHLGPRSRKPAKSSSRPKSNAGEYSVTEISDALKRTLEDTFGHVRVRGEISGFRGPHSSGHCYFSHQGRGRQARRGDLARQLRAAARQDAGGAGGDRHRQDHLLPA